MYLVEDVLGLVQKTSVGRRILVSFRIWGTKNDGGAMVLSSCSDMVMVMIPT